MARGGRRRGTPGKAYGNRTDLNQPPMARFTGQQYGVAAQQARAQAAVPTGPPPTASVPPPATGGNPQPGPAPGPPPVMPGQLGPLDRPTARPGEPITAGLPSGPGPGPEALQTPGVGGDALELQLRALYQMFPDPAIAELLENL